MDDLGIESSSQFSPSFNHTLPFRFPGIEKLKQGKGVYGWGVCEAGMPALSLSMGFVSGPQGCGRYHTTPLSCPAAHRQQNVGPQRLVRRLDGQHMVRRLNCFVELPFLNGL